MLLTITDIINHVIYYNKDNGYIVFKTKNGSIMSGTHIGEDHGDLKNISIVAKGEWKQHKTYGNQFHFKSLEITEDPLFYFLSKIVKGIGPQLAKEIIKKFGSSKTETILNENPTMLRLVKGIKKKKIEKISLSWKKFKHIKEMTEFLSPYGVTPLLIMKIFNFFNDQENYKNFNLVEQIKKNIYILTQIPGIGFKTADHIALSSGISPSDENRIEACIEFIIFNYTKNEGNSCMDIDLLTELTIKETQLEKNEDNEAVAIDEISIQKKILQMVKKETVSLLDQNTVTLPFLKFAEETILKILTQKGKYPELKIISDIEGYIRNKEEQLGFSFSSKQKAAIIEVNRGKKAFLLSGYAGTGKSTIAKAILDLLLKEHPSDKIMCCALSGIASDRIRKTTGYQAATIQSLLVKYKASNEPLEYEVLLIDESSMVNSEIMYKIIKALPKNATIILAGDPAQLPPIGAGNPFSDLIDSKQIPGVELTQIYRQDENSVITLFANQIREAKLPEDFEKNTFSDWTFEDISIKNSWELKKRVDAGELPRNAIEESRAINNTKILNKIRSTALSYSRILHTFLHEKKLDLYISYFQIIAPMKAGTLGIENINKVIQAAINPRKDKKYIVNLQVFTIHLYDKVIHVVNKFMPSTDSNSFKNGKEMEKRKIFNGMLGVVFKIDHEEELIYIYYPNDDIVVEYGFDEARDMIKLAYALTSHKTQGSQFNTVVLPITYSHYIMSNIKLFYTAITRAEKKIILLGERDAFKTGCKRVNTVTRDTIIKRNTVRKLQYGDEGSIVK
jgi:exodeoxyribonuclease V alpha subunit